MRSLAFAHPTDTTIRHLGAIAPILAGLLLLSACGGAATTDDPPGMESDSATPMATDAPDATSEPDATPPAERSGTITVAGQTLELGPDDFSICETVNPAFADDVNIIFNLPGSDESVRLSGTLGEMDNEFDGLFIRSGDLSSEEQGQSLDVSRDGRTVSGTASFDRGAFDFSFTC